MKAFKKYFSGQSSGKGTLISYGRGSEGEEVMIDITEPNHINLKVIVTFIIIFLLLSFLLFCSCFMPYMGLKVWM